jgi:ribosomal protein S18 acetylase RimI-like enzyme
MNQRAVRAATTKDVSDLTTIRDQATAYKLRQQDRAWGKSGWTAEAAQRALDRGGLYVVEEDEISVAIFSLSWQDETYWGPQEPHSGYLHGLCVRDSFHGRGLGSYAVDQCADLVRANNRDRLRLDCGLKNTKLCAYYESLGFIRVGVKPMSNDYVASLYERIIQYPGDHILDDVEFPLRVGSSLRQKTAPGQKQS